MKTLLLIVLSCLAFFSLSAFAECSSCGSGSSSYLANCEGGPSCTANTCQCTDPYCNNPGCMDTCSCCRAFGNVGDNNLNDTGHPDGFALHGRNSVQSYPYSNDYKG